mmetsp:Transcript_33422/g.87661  ORF Transcript_33422/g.87661 Transcript_33422/m.87661 type:complete len:380 (+) Transcript_33422:208-1347(+)
MERHSAQPTESAVMALALMRDSVGIAVATAAADVHVGSSGTVMGDGDEVCYMPACAERPSVHCGSAACRKRAARTSGVLPQPSAPVVSPGMTMHRAKRAATKQEHAPRSRRSTSSGGSKTRLFLPSLYQMCNNDDDDHRDCLCWSDDGTTFWVSNTEKFSRLILPMYFRHNNYASFVRQLNMYGFQRSTESKGKVKPGVPMVEHFTHQFFLRGREDLLGNIHRKTSSVAKASTSAPSSSPGSIPAGKQVEYLTSELRAAEASRFQMRSDVDYLKQTVAHLKHRVAALERDDDTNAHRSKRRRTVSGVEAAAGLVDELQDELSRLSSVKERMDELQALFDNGDDRSMRATTQSPHSLPEYRSESEYGNASDVPRHHGVSL